MKRLLPLLILTGWGMALGQTGQPNCQYKYRFTNRTGEPTDGLLVMNGATTAPIIRNTDSGCVGWQLLYSSEGFSAISLNLQTAPRTYQGVVGASTPGSWSTFSGTDVLSALPLTSTSGGNYIGYAYFPFLRVNLATATGTGTVEVVLNGWKSTTYLASIGGGGGGSGTVTSVGLVGTGNQITVTGTSPITTSGSWTLSLPAGGVTLPGTTTSVSNHVFTGGGTGVGSVPIFTFQNNEATFADFNCIRFSTVGDGVQTRRDNQFACGYNVGVSGAKVVSGDHQFHHNIESYWGNPVGQLEQYYSFTNAAGDMTFRPFGITILTDGSASNIDVAGGFRINTLASGAGQMTLGGDGSFVMTNTNGTARGGQITAADSTDNQRNIITMSSARAISIGENASGGSDLTFHTGGGKFYLQQTLSDPTFIAHNNRRLQFGPSAGGNIINDFYTTLFMDQTGGGAGTTNVWIRAGDGQSGPLESWKSNADATVASMNAIGDLSVHSVIGIGAAPSVATCGTIGTGSKNTAGFITSGTTGSCTSVLTFSGTTAPTGWSCSIDNGTTTTLIGNIMHQTASSTTTATFVGTTVTGDILRYQCAAY